MFFRKFSAIKWVHYKKPLYNKHFRFSNSDFQKNNEKSANWKLWRHTVKKSDDANYF